MGKATRSTDFLRFPLKLREKSNLILILYSYVYIFSTSILEFLLPFFFLGENIDSSFRFIRRYSISIDEYNNY